MYQQNTFYRQHKMQKKFAWLPCKISILCKELVASIYLLKPNMLQKVAQ